jgi:hypothetical protein
MTVGTYMLDEDEIPELPHNWQVMLAETQRFTCNGTRVRMGRQDDSILDQMADKYGLSKASIIRILVHAGLRRRPKRSAR